jgi:hypothetical protein
LIVRQIYSLKKKVNCRIIHIYILLTFLKVLYVF